MRTVMQYFAYHLSGLSRLHIRYPGFKFSQEEEQQLIELAKGVSFWSYFGFCLVHAIFFITMAALVMSMCIPLAFIIDPSHQSAGVFFGCMGFGIFIAFGFGLFITLGLSGIVMGALGSKPALTEISDHAVLLLYEKIVCQFKRVALFIAILFGPFVLFGLTQNGQVVIKLLQIATFVLSPVLLILLILMVMTRRD